VRIDALFDPSAGSDRQESLVAGILAALFVQPIEIRGIARIGMLLPLALSIAIVYKTIRCRELKSIPLASLGLCAMIVSTMLLIGLMLLVASNIMS
jgi:hypothetical protein